MLKMKTLNSNGSEGRDRRTWESSGQREREWRLVYEWEREKQKEKTERKRWRRKWADGISQSYTFIIMNIMDKSLIIRRIF